MTDAPNDNTTPEKPAGPSPDGWAAWGKKAGAPLKPKAGEPLDAPETNESTHD